MKNAQSVAPGREPEPKRDIPEPVRIPAPSNSECLLSQRPCHASCPQPQLPLFPDPTQPCGHVHRTLHLWAHSAPRALSSLYAPRSMLRRSQHDASCIKSTHLVLPSITWRALPQWRIDGRLAHDGACAAAAGVCPAATSVIAGRVPNGVYPMLCAPLIARRWSTPPTTHRAVNRLDRTLIDRPQTEMSTSHRATPTCRPREGAHRFQTSISPTLILPHCSLLAQSVPAGPETNISASNDELQHTPSLFAVRCQVISSDAMPFSFVALARAGHGPVRYFSSHTPQL